LARILRNGELVYLGRIDDQVKIRGHRIELGEIQAALLQQANVSEAVVLAREESPGQRQLAAYVVTTGEQRPTLTELRRALQALLPAYMVPTTFVFLDNLPLTPNGKVDRKALPLPSGKRPELERTYVAPRTPEEKLLTEILSDVLKIEQVGALDNFFELGGHSLVAVQVLSRIRQLAGIELPITTIFTQPTVEGLALALANSQESSTVESEFNVADTSEVVSSLSDQEVDALLAKMLKDE
jgi:acyl carrier protein